MPLVLAGATSGSTTIQATDATTQTLTLPAQTGTVMINGPSFYAYQGSAQTITNTTFTKITFDTEIWDTNNNFASSTFTPTVAGYYQISAGIRSASGFTNGHLLIYKNGSEYLRICNMDTTNSLTGSGMVYANGTTDYFEIYTYQASGASRTLVASSAQTYFQGFLARGA
jgi:hypothetical protein